MIEQAAAGSPERDTDDLEEAFFSTPPPGYEPEIEPWAPKPMSAGERRAMTATIAMLGCAVLAALGFLAFSDQVMVFPAPLTAHAQLPAHGMSAEVPEPVATFGGIAPALRGGTMSAQLEGAGPGPNAELTQAVPAPAAVEVAQVTPQEVAAAVLPATTVAPPDVPAQAVPPVVAAAPRPGGAQPIGGIAPALRGGAMSIADAALKRTPIAPAARAASPADALIKRANAELGRGDAREAQLLANQAILLDPTRARSYIVLGGARDALGDQAGKRAAFQACVRSATDALVSTCRTLAR